MCSIIVSIDSYVYVTCSAKTLHVHVEILPNFRILKSHNIYMIEGNIIKLLSLLAIEIL